MTFGRHLVANSCIAVALALSAMPSATAQKRVPTVQERETVPTVLVVASKKSKMDPNAVLRAAIRAFVAQGILVAKENAERSSDRDSQAWREYSAWMALSAGMSDTNLIPLGITQVVIMDLPECDGVVVALYSKEANNVSFSCVVDREKNLPIRTEASGDFWSGFLKPSQLTSPRGLREWVLP